MSNDNQSVEELLRSLRSTVEKRANKSGEILELRNPINSTPEKCQIEPTDFASQFVQDAVAKSIGQILQQKPEILQKALSSEKFLRAFENVCNEYIDSSDFENLAKKLIQDRIEKMLR